MSELVDVEVKVSEENAVTPESTEKVADIEPETIENPSPVPEAEFNVAALQTMGDLGAQNANLVAQLDEKEQEIEKLNTIIQCRIPPEEVESVLDMPFNQAEQRVVDLAKKNKILQMRLNKERGIVAKQAEEIRKLEQVTSSKVYPQRLRSMSKASPSESPAKPPMNPDRQQMQQLNSKIDSLRRKLDSSAAETKKLQAALMKEMGPSVQLKDVLESSGSWKGRSEQILALRAKVKSLQEKLQNGGGMESSIKSPSDERAKRGLAEQRRQRQAEQQKAETEMSEMRQELSEQKRKMDGMRARNKIVTKEANEGKMKIKVLLQKTGNDDQLIGALKNQVKEIQEKLKMSEQKRGNPKSEMMSSQNEMMLTKTLNGTQSQVTHQEKLITKLRTENKNMQMRLQSCEVEYKSQISQLQDKLRRYSTRLPAGCPAAVAQVEIDRLEELTQSLRKEYNDICSKESRLISRCKELERTCLNLEQQLENGGVEPNFDPESSSVQAMRDTIASQRREIEEVKASYHDNLQTINEEMKQLKQAHAQQLGDLSDHLDSYKQQQAGGRLSARRTDAMSQELQNENQYLRMQLQQMQQMQQQQQHHHQRR
eukprot:TRINITY_DN273_c6_g1_i1.p1 TRINITY_DN273_c6_g1~~TRINITY_DN273_c6_g1_i1.p1  ORF type:complete len:598 (+),score=193.36 TRINITY_DN273_c6_g1_i1:57-1850(+)